MRLLVSLSVVLAMAAAADADPLALTAHVTGSALELAFHNTSRTPITLPTNTTGYDDHLKITLTRTGRAPRTLELVEPRDKFVQRTTDVAAGATYRETIDLVSAAFALGGDPLDPGDYGVNASWDNTKGTLGPAVAVTASATMTIAAPAEGKCTAKPTASGIQLLGRALDQHGLIEVGLHNTSADSICVDARIDAGQAQSDWLSVALDDSMGKPLRTLTFMTTRRAAALVTVALPPGATTWARWDLAAWAALQHITLPHGLVFAEATYDSSAVPSAFHGKVSARFSLQLP